MPNFTSTPPDSNWPQVTPRNIVIAVAIAMIASYVAARNEGVGLNRPNATASNFASILDSPDGADRVEAINSQAAIEDPQCRSDLFDRAPALIQDPNRDVRLALLVYMTNLVPQNEHEVEVAVVIILQGLRDNDPQIADAVTSSLARFEPPEPLTAALQEMVTEPIYGARALEALSKLGDHHYLVQAAIDHHFNQLDEAASTTGINLLMESQLQRYDEIANLNPMPTFGHYLSLDLLVRLLQSPNGRKGATQWAQLLGKDRSQLPIVGAILTTADREKAVVTVLLKAATPETAAKYRALRDEFAQYYDKNPNKK